MSIPLLNPNPSYVLQGAYPCLPPTTVWSYREHILTYPQPQFDFTGSIPLLYPNHSFTTCGGPEVLASTTIFKKCGVQTSSGRQERYILSPNCKLPNLIYIYMYIYIYIWLFLCPFLINIIKLCNLSRNWTFQHFPIVT